MSNKKPEVKFYPPLEEKLNIYSHGLGAILSVIALILMLYKSFYFNKGVAQIAALVYGLSMITLYLASTLYHAEKNPIKRLKLKRFDHIAIYYLIAGTYTPFTLISLSGKTGWIIFAIVWSIALLGTILKIFFTGKFKLLSTLLYVAMGWVIIFVYPSLKEGLSNTGIDLILAGGAAYTIGAVLYMIKAIKFNHAIFHICVLLGSLFHFLSIYYHVL